MNTETDRRTPADHDAKAESPRVPNALTLEAMKELDEGRGVCFDNIEDLFEDLGI